MAAKTKFIKVVETSNGTRFGVDTKGNIWEMDNGSKTKGYRIAVRNSEVDAVLKIRDKDAMWRELDGKIKELEGKRSALTNQINILSDKKNSIAKLSRSTASGYDVQTWNDGRLSVGCVTVDAKTVDSIVRLIKRIKKR